MNFRHLVTSFQRGLDLIAVDRLRQVVGAPHLHSFHGRGDASVPRQHQNLRRSQLSLSFGTRASPFSSGILRSTGTSAGSLDSRNMGHQ